MNENEPDIQPKLTGPAHVLAAASYSLGGIRVLWREQAFRHEILGAAIIFALHIILGVRVWWIVLQTVLGAMLFTAEAVNTAIEKVVDHLSQDWSLFAKEAKDLGSASVFFLLIANGVVVLMSWSKAFGLI